MTDGPRVAADAPVERRELSSGSWVDLVPGFVTGADELYARLRDSVAWQPSRLWRYDHWAEEPRVGAFFTPDRGYPHPALADAHRSIQTRYRVRFDGVALAWYRDGRDGQAFHRDRDLRYCEETVVAILTLGATRPWRLRRRTRADKWLAERGGADHDLAPAGGTLLVMGGRCQLDWEHSVPQVRDGHDAGRISAQWRWTSRTGRPEPGGSYRSPRHFDRV